MQLEQHSSVLPQVIFCRHIEERLSSGGSQGHCHHLDLTPACYGVTSMPWPRSTIIVTTLPRHIEPNIVANHAYRVIRLRCPQSGKVQSAAGRVTRTPDRSPATRVFAGHPTHSQQRLPKTTGPWRDRGVKNPSSSLCPFSLWAGKYAVFLYPVIDLVPSSNDIPTMSIRTFNGSDPNYTTLGVLGSGTFGTATKVQRKADGKVRGTLSGHT